VRQRLRAGDRDLAVVAGIAAVAAVAVLLPAPHWLRTIVVLPLALACPGYAIACAIFPPTFISGEERGIFSISFSIAGIALGGLLLQLVFPLERGVSLALLLALTWGGCLVAARRRRMFELTDATTPRLAIGLPVLAAALLAIGIGIAALVVATNGAERQLASSRFTSLWMVPSKGERAGDIAIGVVNHEGRTVGYHLRVGSVARVERRWSFDLESGESWEQTVSSPAGGAEGGLFASLYRGSTLYRRVAIKPRGAS
jgi:uncharacterized membrane protein